MSGLRSWLHIGDDCLTVGLDPDARHQNAQHLALGPAQIARDFFRHDPPTFDEIERAIDFTEDRIMRLEPPDGAERTLWCRSDRLQPWATLCGPTITIEIVEQWFSRLALAAQGRIHAMDGLPPGREAAATLVVLREFMHHRGHPIVVVAAAASPSAPGPSRPPPPTTTPPPGCRTAHRSRRC